MATTMELKPPTSFTLLAFAAYFLAKHSIASSIWAFSFFGFPLRLFTVTCLHTSSVLWIRAPARSLVGLTHGWAKKQKKESPSLFLINYPIGAFTVQNVRYVESEEREDKEMGEGELAVKERTPICMYVG